jgi:hypothetical protein
MFCLNCGKEISDNAKFCKFCGSQADSSASETPAASSDAVATPRADAKSVSESEQKDAVPIAGNVEVNNPTTPPIPPVPPTTQSSTQAAEEKPKEKIGGSVAKVVCCFIGFLVIVGVVSYFFATRDTFESTDIFDYPGYVANMSQNHETKVKDFPKDSAKTLYKMEYCAPIECIGINRHFDKEGRTWYQVITPDKHEEGYVLAEEVVAFSAIGSLAGIVPGEYWASQWIKSERNGADYIKNELSPIEYGEFVYDANTNKMEWVDPSDERHSLHDEYVAQTQAPQFQQDINGVYGDDDFYYGEEEEYYEVGDQDDPDLADYAPGNNPNVDWSDDDPVEYHAGDYIKYYFNMKDFDGKERYLRNDHTSNINIRRYPGEDQEILGQLLPGGVVAYTENFDFVGADMWDMVLYLDENEDERLGWVKDELMTWLE